MLLDYPLLVNLVSVSSEAVVGIGVFAWSSGLERRSSAKVSVVLKIKLIRMVGKHCRLWKGVWSWTIVQVISKKHDSLSSGLFLQMPIRISRLHLRPRRSRTVMQVGLQKLQAGFVGAAIVWTYGKRWCETGLRTFG